MKNTISLPTCLIIFLTIIGCSSTVKPSEEATQVNIYTTEKSLPSGCISLKRELTGYGSSELEAQYDLAHQAKAELNADSVLLISTESFHQNTRLSNYLRTPTLKAPKATHHYYYEDAFTHKAIGKALQCHIVAQ